MKEGLALGIPLANDLQGGNSIFLHLGQLATLGIGRAIGETIAVLMVTGNAAVIPHTFSTC
jgi:hypothetical protein